MDQEEKRTARWVRRDRQTRGLFTVDLKLTLGVIVTALLLPGRAEATERAPRPAVVKTLRFTIPFTDNTIVNGNRTDSTALGLAFGVLFDETWAAEAGYSFRAGDIGVRAASLRLGVSPALWERGDLAGGWSLHAGPWLGYRHETRSFNDDGYEPEETVHVATGAARVHLTRWWPNRNGLELSFGIGLALPVARRENDTWPLRVSSDRDYRYGVDIGGAVGWSF